jgi:4-carboxymuconolactone decarboxylase
MATQPGKGTDFDWNPWAENKTGFRLTLAVPGATHYAAAQSQPQEQEMAVKPNPSREAVRAVVPRMIELSETVIYGDIWERPGLSKRDRSLIVVAALIASYRPEQLRGHLGRALDNGVTKDEIAEIITHLAFYSGWPGSMTAARIAREVYEERGLI